MGSLISNIKDCAKCRKSLSFCTSDNLEIVCNSEDALHNRLFYKDGRYCANRCDGYEPVDKSRDGKIEQDKALAFMLAGKSEFILHSTKTGDDFKFKITKKESNKKDSEEEFVYFVNILHGSESTYAGHMRFNKNTNMFEYFKGQKGKIEPKDLAIRSLIFVLNKLMRNEIVGNLEVYHTGKCGKCGKKLTTPESIVTGLGPQCSKYLGIPRIKVR
jgi:hypothetical protein